MDKNKEIKSVEDVESSLNGLLNALRDIIKEWDEQHDYLNNPHDDPEDRAIGRTYKECADKLREVLQNRKILYKINKP